MSGIDKQEIKEVYEKYKQKNHNSDCLKEIYKDKKDKDFSWYCCGCGNSCQLMCTSFTEGGDT